MEITEILPKLNGVKKSGSGYVARCPAHDDKVQSLCIGTGEDGKILLHCQAGCDTSRILDALGMKTSDLFSEKDYGKQEAVYVYPGGKVRKVKLRYRDGRKSFYWQHMDNSGNWIKGRNGPPKLYYYKADLDAMPKMVVLLEGEKDVDTCHQIGLPAISTSDGAGVAQPWRDNYAAAFKDKCVLIIPDGDAPGHEFAAKMAEHIQPVAKYLKVIDLSRIWPDMPDKADFTDFVHHVGDVETAWDAVVGLMVETPEWTPEALPEATSEDTKDGKADFLKLFHPLSEFEEQEAEWFIPDWVPKGQITLIAADGGTGKTTTWVNILAAVSAGNRCILDPEGLTREPQKVAFATTEDSIRKKLLRKLKDAGANLENVIAMDLAADKDGLLRKFKFGSPLMELFVREVKPAVFVLDPVQGFIPPEINMGSRNAMRDCLAPLITLGEETGTTFVIIVHSNKRKGAFGRDRIADSADLWDIARSVVMMGYTDDAGIRYLSNEKNNYTALQETILYSINSNGQIVKEGTTWKRDRDFILGSAEAKTSPNRADCKDQIVQILTDAGGGMPTSEMDNKAHVSGYSWATIKRAKRELKDSKRISYFSTGSGRDGTLTWHTKLCDAPEETFDFNYIPGIDDSADGSEFTLDHLTELPDEDVPF